MIRTVIDDFGPTHYSLTHRENRTIHTWSRALPFDNMPKPGPIHTLTLTIVEHHNFSAPPNTSLIAYCSEPRPGYCDTGDAYNRYTRTHADSRNIDHTRDLAKRLYRTYQTVGTGLILDTLFAHLLSDTHFDSGNFDPNYNPTHIIDDDADPNDDFADDDNENDADDDLDIDDIDENAPLS